MHRLDLRGALLALTCAAVAGPAHAQPELTFIAATAAHEYAAKAYEQIWHTDGERIVSALEALTCLRFVEPRVAAVVDDAVSHSGGPEHPMGLRASYAPGVKQATLVHELGHRHLWQLTERLEELDGHRTLYLILDRVWAAVWGEEFAAERIRDESAWQASYDYADAWAWARALGQRERVRLWNRLLALNGFPATCRAETAPAE